MDKELEIAARPLLLVAMTSRLSPTLTAAAGATDRAA
jgi:hypothetical protein